MRLNGVNRPLFEVNGIKFVHAEEGVIREAFEENPYGVEDIPESSTVIDIGAHVGTFSLRCAKERNCTVYSYEPSPLSFPFLAENVKLNSCQDKIKIFNLALGAKVEVRPFYILTEHPVGSSFTYPTDPSMPFKTVQVQTTTLKKIFEDNHIEHCDALKMDCEECEQEVFVPENAEYLRRCDYIALEWHLYDGEKYESFLKKLGFGVLLMGCGKPQPLYNKAFARGMLYAHFRGI